MGSPLPSLKSAVDYIRRHGTAAEQARLRFLLAGQRPPPDVLLPYRSAQRDDGGWQPFWADDASSLDATCYQLAQLESLGLGTADDIVVDGIRFLAERQRPDGSWEEDAELAGVAPPWARPGDQAARLYLTANCGFWLAHSGLMPSAAAAAAVYLGDQLDDEGRLPSFMQSQWLAAALWQLTGNQTMAERSLAYLQTRLGELPAANLAWLLVALRLGGVPAEHPVVVAAAEQLERLSLDSGVWPGEEGLDNGVHVTLEALRALALCGRWQAA